MTEFYTAPNGNKLRIIGSTPANVPASVKRKAHRAIPKPLDGEPVDRGTLMLSMPPPSVNSLFANARKGRRKTLRYANWCAVVSAELRAQERWHVPGAVRITIRSNAGSDVDNRNKALLDALVTAGRIAGDGPKQVVDSRSIHDAGVCGTIIEIERAGG